METAACAARAVYEMRSPAQARLRSCAVCAPSCKRLWLSLRVRTSSRDQRRVACRSRRASAGSHSRR